MADARGLGPRARKAWGFESLLPALAWLSCCTEGAAPQPPWTLRAHAGINPARSPPVPSLPAAWRYLRSRPLALGPRYLRGAFLHDARDARMEEERDRRRGWRSRASAGPSATRPRSRSSGQAIEVLTRAHLRRSCSKPWSRRGGPRAGADRELPGRLDPRELRPARARPLHIVAETQLRIRQCLIARPGASLAIDPPRGLASRGARAVPPFFAERPQIEAVAAYDTAGSVQDLLRRRLGHPGGHRLAPGRRASTAAQVLLEGIEDDPQNYTRFLRPRARAGSRRGERPRRRSSSSSTTCPGRSTARSAPSPRASLDLCKIESRPLRGRPWEYAFYLDVLGDPRGGAGPGHRRAAAACAASCGCSGSYPEGLNRTSA